MFLPFLLALTSQPIFNAFLRCFRFDSLLFSAASALFHSPISLFPALFLPSLFSCCSQSFFAILWLVAIFLSLSIVGTVYLFAGVSLSSDIVYRFLV